MNRFVTTVSRQRWCWFVLMIFVALSPLLIGGILLTAIPAHGAEEPPRLPWPLLLATQSTQSSHDDSRPLQAQLTVGLLADKPADVPLTAYCPPDDAIEAAPGEEIVFCYQLHNQSDILFTRHTIVDDIFKIILENGYFPVSPTTTVRFVLPFAASVTRTNAMTWTVYADNGDSASAFDQATIFVPTLVLTAAVGQTPGACADTARLDLPAAGDATFCLRAFNPSPYPLIGHQVIDAQGNALPLPDDLVLVPGATYTLTSSILVTAPLQQRFTWAARTATRQIPVTATASASVRVPAIDVTVTYARAGATCRPGELPVVAGTSVIFCYTAINDGSTPLYLHRVIDPAIELDHTFSHTLLLDAAVGIVVTHLVTMPISSNVTWYATLEDGRIISATTQGSVTIAQPSEIAVKLLLADEASGVPGVMVELVAPDGIRQTLITDDAGGARFTNLAPGLYFVQVMTPSLDAQLSLISPATTTVNLAEHTVISVEYLLTGTLPVRTLHLPMIHR